MFELLKTQMTLHPPSAMFLVHCKGDIRHKNNTTLEIHFFVFLNFYCNHIFNFLFLWLIVILVLI